jgi:hypothetical protein
MRHLIAAVAIAGLIAAPFAAQAYTLTSGEPVLGDIAVVGCAVTNPSQTASLVIDRIDFIDQNGQSCSALETSGCAPSSGGTVPPGGFSIQQMCNTPTQAPPAGCGSRVRCEVQAHGLGAKKIRALATYVTGSGSIATVPLY